VHPGANDRGDRFWAWGVLTSTALCAVLVGLGAFGIYVSTLAPGLTWAHDSADGGELAAAAYVLGIPHPPGYPVYVLLAHLFTTLPVGQIATRTNLFSACCAACSAALLTGALGSLNVRWMVAFGAGLALAFSPLLWSQATVTEVHALNALFASALLLLAARAYRSPQGRGNASWTAVGIGVTWGLSLGNHPTAVFLAPLVVAALWRLRRWVWHGGGAFVLGLLPYLYLPVRAAASPLINWGDPRTLGRLWWLISAQPYRRLAFAVPGVYLPGRVWAWSGVLGQQFTPVGLAVVALGAVALWGQARSLAVATALSSALCTAFAIGYNTSDSYQYLLPALPCLALWLGVGVDWLMDAMSHRRPRIAQMLGGILIALVIVVAGSRYEAFDLSSERAVDAWRSSVLDRAPPRAIILTRQDAHTFALWYYQYALQERPDVLVVDRDLLQYDWYAERVLQGEIARHVASVADERAWADLLGRPACRIEAPPPGGQDILVCAGEP